MVSSVANASTAVDLDWYAPSSTYINNLTSVVGNNTSGVYGFIYNSSQTPDDEYGAYNWCNMPHVRAREYAVPAAEYELVYVELVTTSPRLPPLSQRLAYLGSTHNSLQIHRHHKRTPYASNSFPTEPYPWDCDDEGLYYFARPFSDRASPTPDAGRNASALAYWRGTSDVAGFANPFGATATGWKGSCQFPQITAAGLDDSWQHGADLYGVYGDLLGFLPARDSEAAAEETWREHVQYRVTNNVITSEVTGMVINGMWGVTSSVPLLIQPSGMDSLEPSYTCAAATAQFDDIKSARNTAWAAHLGAAQGLYTALDGISGVAPDDPGFHASLDHYYDNLSARQCHGKPLPCKNNNDTSGGDDDCVTQALADEVYRLGHWEYSHIYRDAGAASLAASVGSLGVWVAELAAHLRGAVGETRDEGGRRSTLWFHNVAHDGSVSRLLGILQVDVMVWPGMGGEVVFELWKKGAGGRDYYVRVLWGGKVLTSSNPSLGTMDMVPVDTLLA